MHDALFLRDEMTRSYLLQHLEAPHGTSPFAFGGGLRNGGLSGEAMNLLDSIWSFSYMGAAEFEFGAVPAALAFLQAQAFPPVKKKFFGKAEPAPSNLVFGELVFNGKSRAKGYLEIKGKKVYYIAPKPYEAEVKARLERWAVDDYPKGEYFKCGIRLHSALLDEKCRIKGWLELDNGFLFFVDETMYAHACKLFGKESK